MSVVKVTVLVYENITVVLQKCDYDFSIQNWCCYYVLSQSISYSRRKSKNYFFTLENFSLKLLLFYPPSFCLLHRPDTLNQTKALLIHSRQAITHSSQRFPEQNDNKTEEQSNGKVIKGRTFPLHLSIDKIKERRPNSPAWGNPGC